MQHPYFRFLNSLGAHSSAHGIEHFGNLYGELAGLEQHCWLCPLDRLGIIAVSGADAQNFLQAQFSNDIKQVSLEQGQLSGYASPQGRVLAIMQIFMPSQQQYCLSLPHNILQATLKRLSMFILRAQVKLEDISAQLLCAGLGGPGAEDTLVQLDIPVPQQTYAVSRSHECLILRMPDSSPRFAVFANEDRLQAFWQNSIPHIRPTTPYAWHLANIRNGLPSVYAETREQFVAQMLNLDRCNGISFKKGCYPGQEVIARLHYRGEAKRRMQSIRFSGMQAPALNSEIINQTQQVVGHLLEAAPCGETQYEGLAVLQLSLSQDEPLYFAGDPRIEVALMQ